MENKHLFFTEELRSVKMEHLAKLKEHAKLATLPFPEAAQRWLESRRVHIAPSTFKYYESYIATLTKFFGSTPLQELADPDLIRAYQLHRAKKCGSNIINKECSILQQTLKHIGKWKSVAPYYQPLALPRESPGRAMSTDEERKLFEAGESNPNWSVAYWTATISAHTTAGPGEICGLRLRDVYVDDLSTARIYIRENVKNEHRVREIPLNLEALSAARSLVERAKSLGATDPDHFLLPYRVKRGHYDPTRHGKWPRAAWREMCSASGVRIRPYDLRHHALTRLAETQPEQVVLKIAGHVSPAMLRKVYAHVRLPALRSAVNAISATKTPAETTTSTRRPRSRQEQSANTEQALLAAIAKAENLGVSSEAALKVLVEYGKVLSQGKGAL